MIAHVTEAPLSFDNSILSDGVTREKAGEKPSHRLSKLIVEVRERQMKSKNSSSPQCQFL